MLTEPTCDCPRGYSPDGRRLWWVHHASVDCPGNQPPPPPPPRPVRTTVDDLAVLRRVLRGLKADLREADGDLASPARRDWPPHVVVQELTLRDQLELVQWEAERLLCQGCVAARPLLKRVHALLESADVQPGFIAPRTEPPPERVVVPPRAVQLAMERLGFTRAPDDALLSNHEPHDPDLARDWRLCRWWLAQLER